MLSGSVARVGNAISIGTSSRMVTECLLESSSFFMMDSSSSEVVTCCSSWTQHVSMYWSLCKHKLLCSLQAELEPTNVAMKSQEHKDHTNTTWKKIQHVKIPLLFCWSCILKKKRIFFTMVSVFWYYCWTLNGQKSSKHRSDKFWPSQAPRAQKLKGAAIGILSARNWHVSSMVKHEIGEWTEKIVSKYTHISEVDAFGGSATISRINQIERQRERWVSPLQVCPDSLWM